MARADIAALLALGAALFIAVGDVLHQRSAHDVTDEPVGHLELLTRLLRDRQWWLGSLVAAVGFALQAAALGLGSVLVLCVLGASVSSGSTSAMLLAMVSGTLWGVFAVLTKGVIDRLDDGISAVLRTPALYGWALVAIGGAVWQQSSFRAGRLDTGHRRPRRNTEDQRHRVVRPRAGHRGDGGGDGRTRPPAGAVHRPDGGRGDRRIA